MNKTKQKLKLQKRDWAIILLFLAILATNLVWYQYSKSQENADKNEVSAWLKHQEEIYKLKACIDEGTKPCDITASN